MMNQATDPDLRGRPSPVVARVYEIRGLGTFNSAEFFSLVKKEAEALGASLIGREEYDLPPRGDSPVPAPSLAVPRRHDDREVTHSSHVPHRGMA